MDEYLEKLFADAFKREVEQEETVVRSLPFIAAAAAIIVAVIREIGRDAPTWSWTPQAVVLHGLLVLSGLSLVYTGWFVFQALRRRPFRYPRGESEIRETAERLVDFHIQEGLAVPAAETEALADLRREMIAQYALCAENNRRQNETRQASRTRAFHGLMAASLFATLLVTTTYLTAAFAGARVDAATYVGEDQSGSGNGEICSEGAFCRPLEVHNRDVGPVEQAAPVSTSDGDKGLMGQSVTKGD